MQTPSDLRVLFALCDKASAEVRLVRKDTFVLAKRNHTTPPSWQATLATFTKADLDALAPRLFDVLSYVTRENRTFRGACVDATLRHWQDPWVVQLGRKQRHLRAIVDVRRDSPGVQLVTESYKLSSEKRSKGLPPFAVDVYNDYVSLCASELTALFPGWSERFEVALGLGLSERELAAVVCPRDKAPVTVDVALPDVL